MSTICGNGCIGDTKQVAVQDEKQQQQETQQQQEEELNISMQVPFCEANLNFVHNELLYILHPRMQIGDTVYIENAP